jgi:hypothetical protein
MTAKTNTTTVPASSKDVAKKLIKLGVISALLGGSTACSANVARDAFAGGSGRILIDADEKGLRAFGDLITGTIATGKASPDQDTAHHQLRKAQTQVEAMRYTSESFGGPTDER